MARGESKEQGIPADILGPRLLLIIDVLALVLLGCVMVYSASTVEAISDGVSTTSYLTDQVMFAIIGIVAAVIVWKLIPCSVWRGPAVWVVWGIALALLVATAVAGTSELGAQRWLSIGPISLQPSEFAKIAFVLMAARIMDDYRNYRISTRALFIQLLVTILAPILLIYASQSDLGTTLICLIGILAVMWMAEVPLRYILTVVVAGVVFALIAIFTTGYRSDRFVYLDPWNDGENGYGSGWQIIHSYYAFAEGGIFGVGLGNSREKYLYLPEAETDFIYAIIGEELGLIGSVSVIVMFLLLLYAGMRIAHSAVDNFGAMIAGSLTIMIVFQAFLNMGCVIGLLPTTGKPLPFLSSGGSSLIATLIMIGLILSVSEESSSPALYERRRRELRIVSVADEDREGSYSRPSSRPSGSRSESPHIAFRALDAQGEARLARPRLAGPPAQLRGGAGARRPGTSQGSTRPRREGFVGGGAAVLTAADFRAFRFRGETGGGSGLASRPGRR